MPEIAIGNRLVGNGNTPFLIAEAGINHNGNVDRAIDMIRIAKKVGADAVKFQTYRAEELVGDPRLIYSYRSQGLDLSESMLEMFRRCELPEHAWSELKAECDRCEITFLSTPQNLTDLNLLRRVGISAVKVGSDDFTNIPLLKSFAATGLPLILSCGMADKAEIYRSLEAVGVLAGYPTVLLLCTSLYPTPPADVNLNRLSALRAALPNVVLGFSDHTQGPLASSLACTLGASVFEKHFTLDHDLPGPDHWFSEDAAGLADWVRSIRSVKTIMGDPTLRPSQNELPMRSLARRSVIALRDIQKGEIFNNKNIGICRPGTGLPPDFFETVLGGVALRDLPRGTPVCLGDVGK